MCNKLLSILLLLCLFLPCALGEEAAIPQVKGVRQQPIPDNEAMAFVKNMKIGWNLGNTFDAINDGYVSDEMSIESYWCGVKTTEDMIEMVHQAGFNTLRLPVSWHNHVDESFTINTQWLDRVQQVVDWAIQRDMYVILNIHHDVYPAYMYPNSENYATAEKYVTAIWQQLAERFQSYDEHLIFESMNEPRLKDTAQEWWFNQDDPLCQDSADCINRLNQAFVDTVRASGGNNADRYLMIPGYCASPDSVLNTDYFHLPADTADNKLIVSVHAYKPYDFALNTSGTDEFSATNTSQYTEVVSFLSKLYKTYVANGIPVVVGEFGAVEKNANVADRAELYAYYLTAASARNIPCIIWDNNNHTGSGERFGLLDRKNLTWPNEILVQSLMQYAGYDAIPAQP